MGLKIKEDVLFYNENNTNWKPLPMIKGENGAPGTPGADGDDGLDAYHVWLEKEHLEDTTENYRIWLQRIGRAAAIGASRVVVEDIGGVPTKVAYTPKKLNPSDTQEPPAEGTQFVTYDGTTASCDRIVLGGDSTVGSEVRYKGITTTYNKVNPILFAPTYPVDGSLISEVGYIQSPSSAIGDVGYNPTQFVFVAGNRSTATNKQRTGADYGAELRLCAHIGDVTSLPTAYKGPQDIDVAFLNGTKGNLYIGGIGSTAATKDNNATNYCPRGSVIINAGLGSLYGKRYTMTDTTTASTREENAPNAVLIQRGKSGTTGVWAYYNNVDSGHVEHIRVPVNLPSTVKHLFGNVYYPGPVNAGSNKIWTVSEIEANTAQWNVKTKNNWTPSAHNYDVVIQTNNKYITQPHIQYSVLGEEMAYISPFEDYFHIWGVRYNTGTGRLSFSIACKKELNANDVYPKYDKNPVYVYIDFMLFTKDYK